MNPNTSPGTSNRTKKRSSKYDYKTHESPADNDCGASFNTKRALRVHINRVHLKKNYECHLCPESYSQNGLLMRHLRQSHKKFCCTKCESIFDNPILLKKNVKDFHFNTKPYECN